MSEPDLQTEAARFTAMGLHELRSPLTVIIGAAATLDEHWDSLVGEEHAREVVQSIRRNGLRLQRLVEELLLHTRLDEEPEAVVVAATSLASAVRVAQDIAGVHAMTLLVEGDADVRVLADAARLDQVVAVLVENAFAHGLPPVRLQIAAAATTVELALQDKGSGVPNADRDALFVKFSRLSAGKSGCNGLGLSIARRLVERMGGTIAYSDEAYGPTFTVTLRRPAVPLSSVPVPASS